MALARSKCIFEAWPESVFVHVFGFVLPSSLTLAISVSYGVSNLLSDRGGSSSGAFIWQAAFASAFWRPASFESLQKAVVPHDFRWHTECLRRLQMKESHRESLRQLASQGKSCFVFRHGWAEPSEDPDGCLLFEYVAHHAREISSVYPENDVADADDTVAVINLRASCLGPDEAHHVGVPDDPSGVWRGRLPGARRLRYFEVEVKSPGEHGYISCGAVLSGKAAIRLRGEGKQPGWGSWDRAQSVGYHGDDGRLYPGPSDHYLDILGQPFGPRFSAPRGSPDASVRPAGAPPVGAHGESRVVGMGMDLDRKQFFFTADGALVGEVRRTNIDIAQCVPVVGLHSRGEKVRINLGLAPFWFPIEAYSADATAVPKWSNPEQWSADVEDGE